MTYVKHSVTIPVYNKLNCTSSMEEKVHIEKILVDFAGMIGVESITANEYASFLRGIL